MGRAELSQMGLPAISTLSSHIPLPWSELTPLKPQPPSSRNSVALSPSPWLVLRGVLPDFCKPPPSSLLHFVFQHRLFREALPGTHCSSHLTLQPCSPVDYFLCSLVLQPSRPRSEKILSRDMIPAVVWLVPFSELMQD